MSRDPLLYLEDMDIACRKILRYTSKMSFNDFITDERTFDAVIRNIEIIGEAVKNIPETIKIDYDQVEWRAMAALRNIVAHSYFSVKDEIIWDIIQNKIRPLHSHIEHIISEME
ncbi:MAG: DUF86 domain-containing protein [Anaerolineaceae bacterium]|nr:DUF86 domain-containing protein [Anaerolineaceae bacterium]